MTTESQRETKRSRRERAAHDCYMKGERRERDREENSNKKYVRGTIQEEEEKRDCLLFFVERSRRVHIYKYKHTYSLYAY